MYKETVCTHTNLYDSRLLLTNPSCWSRGTTNSTVDFGNVSSSSILNILEQIRINIYKGIQDVHGSRHIK